MSSTQDISSRRLGFHYYPDTLHYQVQDLEQWVPELLRMGASWLTMLAPLERAIPEYFITGLVENGIQPVLHFQMPVRVHSSMDTIHLLLRQYARWGVQWVSFFDTPNSRRSWAVSDWAQSDLVERFLDLFLPLAAAAVDEGLTPVLAPLEPGGDYWDLSFLQSSLQGLKRRAPNGLLERLALSAYAWTKGRSLDWGIGGPERWTGTRPYHPAAEGEDHLGFRIFDWYNSIARQELGGELPLLLLRAGSLPSDAIDPQTGRPDLNAHAQTNLVIAQALEAGPENDPGAIPANVICCCLWLLCAEANSPHAGEAWFGTGDDPLPVVNAFYRWGARRALVRLETGDQAPDEAPVEENAPLEHPSQAPEAEVDTVGEEPSKAEQTQPPAIVEDKTPLEESSPKRPTVLGKFLQDDQSPSADGRAISHYVLLPLYAWGAAEWDVASIQPLLEDSHPTIGFSLEEARLAARVTVVGGAGAISDEALEMLRANGCKVERVLEDGTLVAP